MSKTNTVMIAMALAVASAALPSIAMAGPYVGVGIGGTHTESTLKDLDLVPQLASDLAVIGSNPDFSSTDVSLEFTVGWMINQHFGVEIGYTDFGEARDYYVLPESCNTFGCQSRQWTATMQMDGIQAFVVGSTPVSENLDAYLKLGAIAWDADYAGYEKNVAFIPGAPIGERNERVDYNDSGTDLAAAMGFNLKTGTPFSIRTEFAYYDIDTTDYVWIAQLMGIYTF
jgi:opacity protein-like surface antigen